ncbi:hypothetical protein CSW42_05480 [Thermus scotoductus]|nr:hypothetical protein CSW42_05480 [Thermus scotoductus]
MNPAVDAPAGGADELHGHGVHREGVHHGFFEPRDEIIPPQGFPADGVKLRPRVEDVVLKPLEALLVRCGQVHRPPEPEAETGLMVVAGRARQARDLAGAGQNDGVENGIVLHQGPELMKP